MERAATENRAAPGGQIRSVEVEKIRNMCRLCLNRCGIIVTVENGKVVRIDGDPDNPYTAGYSCAKGRSGFYTLYSPSRVTKPLKRTNPEKGPGIDPGWQEIGWDEALDTVAEKLKELREEDAAGLWYVTFDFPGMDKAWPLGFGSRPQPFSSGVFCGNAVHPPHLLNQSAIEAVPDVPLTKYILSVGGQFGTVVHYDTMNGAHQLGLHREGIRFVSVDPVCTHSASMADEWVPILPGTDSAFLLALANLLINELGIYDAPFLKLHTNAPYLVGTDGRYVRDRATRKPLVWDADEGKARPFDAPVSDHALFGVYEIEGQEARPAFQIIADHVRMYTPEEASRITSIPATTIERIAREFGEAASIGATIRIDGEELPYRPAAITWYRGLSSHKHAHLNGFAVMLIQTIIGGLDVPGGLMGYERAEYRETEDGLLALSSRSATGISGPYPPRTVTPPRSLDLFELFPVACYSRPFAVRAILEPERYGNSSAQPKMLMHRHANLAFTGLGKETMTEVLRQIPFIVSIVTEIDETAEFADVVLPGLHHLERLDLGPGLVGGEYYSFHTGSQPAAMFGHKPASKPPFDPPWDQIENDVEILLELARRADFSDDVYEAFNVTQLLTPEYQLEPGKQYSYREIVDRTLKAMGGPDKGLQWFMDDGLAVRERTLTERYPGAYPKPRIHVYHEYMIDAGQQVDAVTRELNIPWDTSDYIPLAEWRPCPANSPKAPEFDLYMVTAKVPYHVLSASATNPLLNEVASRLGYNEVGIHRDAAQRKGLKDGDWVEVETDSGKKGRARVKLTRGIHPEVTVVWGSAGGWAKARAASGEEPGIHFNSMLAPDDEHLDHVSAAMDSCLRVKITKLRKP